MDTLIWICEYGYPDNFSFVPILNDTKYWKDENDINMSKMILMYICIAGIIGNALNIILLSAKRCVRKLTALEKNANMVLTVLAASDLLFCVLALVYPFTKDIPYYVTGQDLGYLLFRYYGHAVVNLCLMTSTYMVVILAIQRYIVMYFPLKAKIFLSPWSTMWVIGIVLALCVCSTLPYFINNMVASCYSIYAREVFYELLPRWHYHSISYKVLTIYMTKVWPALAVFVPLFVLFFCNLRLIQGLQQVMLLRTNHQSRKYQVTLTLVIIVFMCVLLATPAEVIKLINPYETWGDRGYKVAEVVNFAANFFLYCIIDKDFRQMCGIIFGCKCNHTFQTEQRIYFRSKNTTSTRTRNDSNKMTS